MGEGLASRSHGRTSTSWSRFARPSRYISIFSCLMARILYATCKLVKCDFAFFIKFSACCQTGYLSCSTWEKIKKSPRSCRVSPGFEPACAGGSWPGNAALAQAYRVISFKIRTLLNSVGSKREGNITHTAGLYFLYHNRKGEGR